MMFMPDRQPILVPNDQEETRVHPQVEEPTPDRRMLNLTGGFDEHGTPKPMTYSALREVARSWPRTSATPPAISQLLETTRDLFAYSFYEYEFLVVAGVWSLVAVEAALRLRLESDGKPNLKTLIERATQQGLLEAGWEARLDAGRQLRNNLAHEHASQIWSFGMADLVIKASHEVTALLFPE